MKNNLKKLKISWTNDNFQNAIEKCRKVKGKNYLGMEWESARNSLQSIKRRKRVQKQ